MADLGSRMLQGGPRPQDPHAPQREPTLGEMIDRQMKDFDTRIQRLRNLKAALSESALAREAREFPHFMG